MSNITSKPIKPQDLDLSSVSFSAVKSMSNGSKLIYVNYKGGMLFLQSPELNISMDTGTYWPGDSDNTGKYAIRTSLDGYQNEGPMKSFHDAIQSMDKLLISKAIESKGEWFEGIKWYKKKGTLEEKVTENYTPMVKVSTDSETGEPNGKWPPSFSYKIMKRDGKVMCDCYDSNKNVLVTEGDDAINLENMFKKGTKVKAILKCSGIWMSTAGWGCTWKVEQIKIDAPMGFSGYSFEDTDEEDDSVPLTRTESVVKENLVDSDEDEPSKTVDQADNSSDDDSGEEEEEEEEQAVVKRKVKK